MNCRNLAVLLLVLLAQSSALRAQQNQTSIDAQWAAIAKQRSAIGEAMLPSLEKQMASVRKQLGAEADSKRFFVLASSLPVEPVAPEPACDSLSPLSVQPMARKAAESYRVDPDLVMAVIRQESAFQPCVVSSKGAMGLMQLMPATASDLGVQDAFDPQQNIAAGTKLLRDLLDRYSGDLNRALGAYNAGPRNVNTYGGVPPFPETENYIDSIMRTLDSSRRQH